MKIKLTVLVILVSALITGNCFAQRNSNNHQNSGIVRLAKYHGEFIPSVSLPEITITASAVAVNQSESKNPLKSRSKIDGFVNYHGEIIPLVHLPVEVCADRNSEITSVIREKLYSKIECHKNLLLINIINYQKSLLGILQTKSTK